jgi:hypothetical protein
MLSICSCQLEHADHRDILVKPAADLGIIDGDRTDTLTWLWVLVHLFAQHTGNRIAMMSGEFGDLDIGPAFVFQKVNS